MKKRLYSMIPIHKTAIAAFCLSALLLVLTYIASQWMILRIEKRDFIQDLHSSTKDHLSFVKMLFDNIVSDLRFTVYTLQKYDDIWQEEAKEALSLSHHLNFCDATFVADTEGNAYAHTGYTFSIADQDFFQDTLCSTGLTFSDILPSQRYGAIQIISLPIYKGLDEKEIQGYLFGLYDVNRFSQEIDTPHDSGEYVYIVDSQGTYINTFSTNQDISGGRNFWDDFAPVRMEGTTIEELEKNFHTRTEGDFSYSYGDIQRYGYHMPLGIRDWQIVLSIDGSVVDSRVKILSTVATSASFINWGCLAVMLWCVYAYFKRANREIRKVNEVISKNHEIMKIAVESSNRAIFEYSIPKRTVEFKTKPAWDLFGSSVLSNIPDSLVHMGILEGNSIDEMRKLLWRIEREESSQADFQMKLGPDAPVWCRIYLQNIYSELGDIISTVGFAEDISMLKQGEDAIKRKEELHRSLIKNSLMYGRVELGTGMIVELNGSTTRIAYETYIKENAPQYVCMEHQSYVLQSLSLEALRDAYQQGKEYVEVQFQIPSGDTKKWVSTLIYRVHESEEDITTFVIRDIDKKKREELALKARAEIDGLTGLYNAATVKSNIHALLSLPHKAEEKQILILFDLDNFKKINDTFGHAFGDQVLIDMAGKLKTHFRSTDIAGRLGGDEFAAMICDVKSDDYYIDTIISSLCEELEQTYTQNSTSITVSASIGIAVSPQDGTTFEELYKKADTALYQVKRSGKNGYRRWAASEGPSGAAKK